MSSMEEDKVESLNLKLSFVDRVEEKLTSPDREIISPTKKSLSDNTTEETLEDVNGNVPEQLAENLDRKFQEESATLQSNANVEKVSNDADYLNTVLHISEEGNGNSREKSDVKTEITLGEGFVDRRETYLQFDLKEDQDLKIDMERQKQKRSEASFQWYVDQNRRDKMFESKLDVDLSQTKTDKERVSSQLLEKTKEMYFMDSKKDIHDSSSEAVTDNVKIFNNLNSERFEMYTAINQSSNLKVDEMLPEVMHEYGNFATDVVSETQVNTELLMKSPGLYTGQNISALSNQTSEQKLDLKTEKIVTNVADGGAPSMVKLGEGKVQSMGNTTSEDSPAVSSKIDLEKSTNEDVEQSLIFEEDEENVIIHFGSEFSQDQQDDVVVEKLVKQEIQNLQQETNVIEIGYDKKMTVKNTDSESTSLENIPPVPAIEVERKFKVTSESRDKLIELGATLLEEKVFTDRYYDNDKYSLTLSDAWLRQRNASWELKLGRHLSEKAGLSTQYNEISDEKEIVKFLTKHFKLDSSFSDRPLLNLLNEIELSEFAVFTTTRQSYGLPECTVDLDLTDFGFQVGEVEVMVMDESHIPEALDTITDIAGKLGCDLNEKIAGKLSSYLRTNRPDQYKCLVKAEILPLITEWADIT